MYDFIIKIFYFKEKYREMLFFTSIFRSENNTFLYFSL